MAPIISIILHHSLLLAAANSIMLVMASSSSVELAEAAPSGSGNRFQLIRKSLRYSDHEYLVRLPIGNSWLSGVADTGSDLIWTNNSQLIDLPESCPRDKEDCCLGLRTFKRTYSGSTVVKGFMGEAKLTPKGSTSYTLTIGSAIMLGGCQHLPGNAQDNGCNAYKDGGIVALGRGNGSLMTQLRLHNFSYCLAERKGFIQLNGSSSVALPKQQNTTGFALPANREYPLASRYFVRPKKIVLGGAKGIPENVMEIPNACPNGYNENGDGVMAIDSGNSFTMLPKEVLLDVTKHVTKLMKKEPKDKKRSNNKRFTCYDVVKLPKYMPDMILHFCDGAQMVIPVDNYMYLDKDKKGKEYCLVFEKALDKHPRMSILGNFQQRNMRMLFDIKRNTLSFIKHKCGRAQEKEHAAV